MGSPIGIRRRCCRLSVPTSPSQRQEVRGRCSRLRGISGESAGRCAGRRAQPRFRTPRRCRRRRRDRSRRGPQSPCHPTSAEEQPGAARPQKADPREHPRKPYFDPQTPVPSSVSTPFAFENSSLAGATLPAASPCRWQGRQQRGCNGADYAPRRGALQISDRGRAERPLSRVRICLRIEDFVGVGVCDWRHCRHLRFLLLARLFLLAFLPTDNKDDAGVLVARTRSATGGPGEIRDLLLARPRYTTRAACARVPVHNGCCR